MSWPHWIDELKERYLADEGNVFVLYGDVKDDRWTIDGASLDCVEVLVAFLQRTRQVVGVLRPERGLSFAMVDDAARFDRLVSAQEVMLGDASPLSNKEPLQALARVWRALGTAGTDQGYIVTGIDAILPGHRKRVDPIPGGTPALFEWPRHPRLVQSNNIVLFLAESRSAVREELLATAVQIHVDVEPEVPIDQAVALAHLEDDVSSEQAPAEAPPSAAPPAAPPEAPPPAASDDPVEALRPEMKTALVHALVVHPEEHRTARIPVMDAVASVLASQLPGKVGDLTFSLDEEGAVTVEGTGADWFQSTWKGDIALDAAGGMLIKALRGGFSEQSPPDLDDTALTALTKRVVKIVARERG